MSRSVPAFDRRAFLVGAGAVVVACSTEEAEPTVPPQLVALFSPDRVIAAGRPQRLPFGLIDNGAPLVDDTGDVAVTVLRDGEEIDQLTVAARIVSHDHPDGDGSEPHEHSDILRYFALRTTLPEPGIYDLIVDLGDAEATLPVQAFDPAETTVPLSGEPFPIFPTPTVDNAGGVDPICTRAPEPCPFHGRSADEILAEGEPMALLVSTPLLCMTSYCGPVLEVLIEAAPDFPSIAMVHSEVYANPKEVEFNIADERIVPAPTLIELGLTFEPSLFLVDRNGVIAERIDNVFDGDELTQALAVIA